MIPTEMSRLRVRLVALVLLAVVPALLLQLYTGYEDTAHETDLVRVDVDRLADIGAASLSRFVEGARQLSTVVAQLPSVKEQDPAAISSDLVAIQAANPLYNSLGVVDVRGRPIATTTQMTRTLDVSDRTYFRRAMDTRRFAVGDYLVSRLNGNASLVFACPVLNPAGDVQYVVTLGLNLERLGRFMTEHPLHEGTMLGVIDANGIVLAHSRDPEQWVGRALPENPPTSERRLDALRPVPDTDDRLRVWVSIPESAAFARTQGILQRNLILLSAVGLLALLVARAGGARLIAFVERSQRELRAAHDGLRKSEARYRAVVEDQTDMIARVLPDGTLTFVNEAYCRAFGQTPGDSRPGVRGAGCGRRPRPDAAAWSRVHRAGNGDLRRSRRA